MDYTILLELQSNIEDHLADIEIELKKIHESGYCREAHERVEALEVIKKALNTSVQKLDLLHRYA